MALHVTQCPSCESSFNTNAQLLKAASGKVRCGSCLLVFVASDNFLESANDSDESSSDSVFVGNDPNTYFDPSVFLTRRALQEASVIERKDIATETAGTDSTTDQKAATPSQAEQLLNQETEAFSPEPATQSNSIGVEPATTGANEQVNEQQPGQKTEQKTKQKTQAEGLSSEHSDPTQETNPEDLTLAVSFSLQHSKVNDEAQDPTVNTAKPHSAEFKANTAATHFSATIGDTPIRVGTEEPDREIESNPVESESEPPVVRNQITSDDPEPEQKQEQDESDQSELRDSQGSQQEALAAAIADDSALIVKEVISERSPTGDHPPLAANSESMEQHAQVDAGEHSSTFDDELYDPPLPGFELEPDKEDAPSQPNSDNPLPQDDAPAPESDLSTEEIRARALGAEFEDEEALEAIPTLNLDQFGKMATPVDLGSAKRKHWGATAALGLVSLLLAATLAGQYFWRNLPLYSQLEQFRPAYVTACTYLNCELPPYSNVDAIVSDELNIRSHPEEINALAVTISFRNTATVAQRFPVIILSFNSSQNEIVALREFSPGEYLSEGLQDIDEMPPGAPVQVQLAIMDPGPFAVNYTLAFRNP
ncbi:MAG: zinc-ribbon and DUF3426 domain-containing protein [Pseudohongiellaceae bacterium]